MSALQFHATDRAWYQRRDEVLAELRQHDAITCADLCARFGWDSHEVRAKLMSLRKVGLATYDDGWWSAR